MAATRGRLKAAHQEGAQGDLISLVWDARSLIVGGLYFWCGYQYLARSVPWIMWTNQGFFHFCLY